MQKGLVVFGNGFKIYSNCCFFTGRQWGGFNGGRPSRQQNSAVGSENIERTRPSSTSGGGRRVGDIGRSPEWSTLQRRPQQVLRVHDEESEVADERLAQGLYEGMAQGLYEGMAQGLYEGMAQGLYEGMAQGLYEGMAQGLSVVITHKILSLF